MANYELLMEDKRLEELVRAAAEIETIMRSCCPLNLLCTATAGCPYHDNKACTYPYIGTIEMEAKHGKVVRK